MVLDSAAAGTRRTPTRDEARRPVRAAEARDAQPRRRRRLPPLALPPLGSFLWSEKALPHLDAATLPNAALLDAIRALATVRDGRVLRSVDYKNLGAEELGSVYESLLELHPDLNADAGTFALTTAAGNERKTTGSYYTPSSLIAVLLDSALDPVLDEAAAKGEEAILDLKVCDPACGSGHFLVAASHRIAKRLASVRTGEEEPSPEATRAALRDVVSRCLHGVDVNPMAVELCKVSLWMDALDPGRPLSFLDAHIKCGNSLLGTTVELLKGGIPDDAYKPLEGDDTDAARVLRNGNRDERLQIEGQLTLEDWGAAAFQALQHEAEKVESAEGMSLDQVRAQERLYSSLLQSEPYERAKLAADAWCAAFVQRKKKDAPRITTALVRRLASGQRDIPLGVAAEVNRLAAEYGFFHWGIEYPAVFGRPAGGFDVVLGNPPWERVKVQEKEFFASQTEIARTPNAAARKRLIAALETDDPPLFESWKAAQRRSEGESQLLRASGRYPLCGRGDVNTYAVFAELMRSLLGFRGRVGCVVPTGIATDATTQFFFRDLVESRSLASLYSFENEAFIFPAIHHATKFCLLAIAGSEDITQAELVFFAREVSEVYRPERRFALAPDDFALINPNTRTCPTFRSARDAELTKMIYRRVPVLLRSTDPAENPWHISFLAMFHMTNDSHLFHPEEADDRMPLYEGKMVHLFDHRFGTYDGQTDAQAAQGKLPELTDSDHGDPDRSVCPRSWVDRREVQARLAGRWDKQWLLGWRDITSSVVLRTVIPSAIPRVAVGNNMPLLFSEVTGKSPLLMANLSSFALDYVARQKLGGTHLNYFLLEQLPVLKPDAYDAVCPWGSPLVLSEWLTPRYLELVYTAWDIAPFARDHGYAGPPFRWDSDRRSALRAELDAAYFRLYGIERDDVDYIMDTFWVVRDRDVKAHGEYRTKRLILQSYDELAEAVATGRPHQTRLDPPPADPRVAHAPRSTSPAAVAGPTDS